MPATPEPPETPAPPLLDPALTRLLIWIARLVLFLLALYTVGVVWPAVRGALVILSPFLIGLVLAYILDPVVTVVQRRLRMGRVGGLLALFLFLLALGALVLGIVLPIVVTQIGWAVTSARAFLAERIPVVVEHLREQMEATAGAGGLEPTSPFVDAISVRLLDWESYAGEAASIAWGGLSGVAGLTLGGFGLVMTGIFVGIIGFYLLLDFHRITPQIDSVVPVRHRDRFWRVMGTIHTNLSGFLRGQILVCLCMGAMVTVGLLIVGPRQYALLIGLLAGTMNFIPYLGPAVGAAPAVLWALLSSSVGPEWSDHLIQMVKVLAVFAAAQSIDGFFISPKIIGDKAAMHPLLVMLALIVGAQGGLGGMIIAVPAAIILKALFVELLWRPMLDRRTLEKEME